MTCFMRELYLISTSGGGFEPSRLTHSITNIDTRDFARDPGHGARPMHDDQPESPVGIEALLSFEGRVNRATFWTTWLALVCGVAAAAAGTRFINPRSDGIFALASIIGALL